MGESGCGKSTLAKVLVGLQPPTSGTVSFRGRDLWALKESERRAAIGSSVGMIFQDPSTALNRRLPISQVLRDPLDVHRRGTPAQRDARVRELLDLVGLPASAADALPSQLSGGQRQRVAIARALALEPELLIADEPTSALDVSVRAQILNLLLDLKERLGLALVFVSHDIQTVRRMSDRVITMYLGRIVEQTPAEVLPRARGTRTPGRCSPPRPACSRRSTRSRWSARSRRRPGRPAAARSAPGAGGPTTCAAPCLARGRHRRRAPLPLPPPGGGGSRQTCN